jgi:hypothetical protein
LFRRSKRGFFYIKFATFLLSPFYFHSLFSSFVSYTRCTIATFYVVAVILELESTTLSLFLGTLVFHLLFAGLIRFFVLQEFNWLDVNCFIFLQHPIFYTRYWIINKVEATRMNCAN